MKTIVTTHVQCSEEVREKIKTMRKGGESNEDVLRRLLKLPPREK